MYIYKMFKGQTELMKSIKHTSLKSKILKKQSKM